MLTKFQTNKHKKMEHELHSHDSNPYTLNHSQSAKAIAVSWKCAKCTLHNDADKQQCDACLAPRPCETDDDKSDATRIGIRNIKQADLKQHKSLQLWLCNGLGLDQYYNSFVEEGFDDMSLLCHLDENRLLKLGVHKMAHRLKLMTAIATLNNTNEDDFDSLCHDTQEQMTLINQLQNDAIHNETYVD
eukprot:96464_1